MKDQRVGVLAPPGGWVPLMRTLADHPVMGRPPALSLYILLLFRARYRPDIADIGGEVIELGVGQCVFGRKEAAKALGLTEREVRTAQRFLEKTGLIERKATNRGTIVTVCHYKTWERRKTDERPADDQPATSRPTTNEHLDKETKRKENKASAKADGFRSLGEEGIEPETVKLAKTWSSLPGVRRADPSYVSEGLSRGLIEAEELRMVMDQMLPVEPPIVGETLWAWYRPVIGEWFGSEVEYS